METTQKDNAQTPIVEVQTRTPYGTMRTYPMNEAARTFAKLTGKATFSNQDLQNIAALGFKIVWIPYVQEWEG